MKILQNDKNMIISLPSHLDEYKQHLVKTSGIKILLDTGATKTHIKKEYIKNYASKRTRQLLGIPQLVQSLQMRSVLYNLFYLNSQLLK